MIVSAIAAIGKNGVIGREGKLPGHLPDDLKRFRAITWGKPIIMGRKTHESLGRALPGRTNIVLTRTTGVSCDRLSWSRILRTRRCPWQRRAEAEEVLVIGGSEVFRQFMPWCEKVYLTIVEGEFEGDAFFPADLAGLSGLGGHPRRTLSRRRTKSIRYAVSDPKRRDLSIGR